MKPFLMTLNFNKVLMMLPIVGMFIFYMWQPISDFFITGSYNDNVVLNLEGEMFSEDKTKQLIAIHIKPYNNGKMPITILDKDKKGSFTVEVRKIDDLGNAKFVDYSKMPVVANIDILRHYKDGYIIEAGAVYDEVEAITLPLGFYWVNAKLTFSDGDYVNQSMVVKLTNEKQ